MTLTAEEQAAWRQRFRRRWEQGVAFNRVCEMTVEAWEPAGVRIRIPFREELGGHEGVFHGGVVSALVDTAGCGAVAAGHDFANGDRITTVSMSIQFLSVDPFAGMVADARCTRRGRQINFAEVVVRSDAGKELAHGLVTVSATHSRPDGGSNGG